MKQKQQNKHFLNLSGEYGVCSELAKRGITANLTFGNYKAVDVIIVNVKTNKAYTIEVKTTSTNRIVTGFFQKYYSADIFHPDFWVFVLIDKTLKSKYYILFHWELEEIQMQRNGMEVCGKVIGVDNILVNQIEKFENKWDKIISSLE